MDDIAHQSQDPIVVASVSHSRCATSANFRTRPVSSHSIHSRCAASRSSNAGRPVCAAYASASALAVAP